VTNLVRVALEPIALVFLRERRAEGRRKELSRRETLYAFARTFLSISNSNSKRSYALLPRTTNKGHHHTRKKKTKAARYLFAHVQLELLHGRVVELQTAHELVRLERHDDV
tara:strand:+ start:160 stop:492 length:333 start_codon:yes stop_codon:yes gene_type:complete